MFSQIEGGWHKRICLERDRRACPDLGSLRQPTGLYRVSIAVCCMLIMSMIFLITILVIEIVMMLVMTSSIVRMNDLVKV